MIVSLNSSQCLYTTQHGNFTVWQNARGYRIINKHGLDVAMFHEPLVGTRHDAKFLSQLMAEATADMLEDRWGKKT